MADYEQADARLMDWLAERTDTELQRLLDAPEDGLTNEHYSISEDPDDGTCRACLVGWAFGWESVECWVTLPVEDPEMWQGVVKPATGVLHEYGLRAGAAEDDDGTVMRRIQGFAAAELLTRRVERPKLPAPVEVCTADPLNSGYREEA